MASTNLLEETLYELKARDKSSADVEWVGTSNGNKVISWDEFAAMAAIEYDSGFGGNEILGSLVVVGEDWWLSRGEYDGSEWWNFNKKPEKAAGADKLTNITE